MRASANTESGQRVVAIGATIGLFTLLKRDRTYVRAADRRWRCRCSCGAEEYRTERSLLDTRYTPQCNTCRSAHGRAAALARREKRAIEAPGYIDELRAALEAVATPRNLQRILSGRRLGTKELLVELGIHCGHNLSAASDWLRRNGCRKAVIASQNVWEWVGIEAPKPAFIGPGLEAGAGEKRDCARWTSCLTMFALGTPRALEGRCPSGCSYFSEPRRADALRAAIDNVSFAHAGANFGGVG